MLNRMIELDSRAAAILDRFGVCDPKSDLVGRLKHGLKLTGWENTDGRMEITVALKTNDGDDGPVVLDLSKSIYQPGPWEQNLERWYSEALR